MVESREKSEFRERPCMREGEQDHKTSSYEDPELVLGAAWKATKTF